MSRSLPRRHLLAATAAGLLAGCTGNPSGTAAADSEPTEPTDSPTESAASESTEAPRRVDPEDAGLVVTDTEIDDVDRGRYWTIISATVTVENVSRFSYRTVELRVDAFWSGPNVRERTPAGFEYVSRRFGPDNRFESGTREFPVDIRVRSRGDPRSDADWVDLTAAVRHAEPRS